MRAAYVFFIAAVSAQAVAKDITITLSDLEQQTWTQQIRGVVDQCVAGAALRSDAAVCRDLAAYLAIFADKVRAAMAAAPPPKDEQPKEEPK